MSLKSLPNEVLYISFDSVLAIHTRQLEAFGGRDGIRNKSGLESAIEVPKSTFDGQDLYPTIFLKAAAYAYHISESQAFVDGNKRAALDVALTFLSINGYDVENEAMELYDAMIAIAEKKMTKEDLAKLFERLVSK